MFWDTYKAICKESVPEHYASTVHKHMYYINRYNELLGERGEYFPEHCKSIRYDLAHRYLYMSATL